MCIQSLPLAMALALLTHLLLPSPSFSSSLPSSLSQPEHDCFGAYSCLASGPSLLRSSSPVATASSCQALCSSTPGCLHFTHYSSSVTPHLALSCWLYTSCSRRRRHCSGCTSGPPACGLACSLPPPAGGRWWCTGNSSSSSSYQPGDWDTCHHTCGGSLTSTTCLAGRWDKEATRFVCPCSSPPPGTVSCDQLGPPYPGGTSCSSTCSSILATTCQDGGWTEDLSGVQCEEEQVWMVASLALLMALALLATFATWFLLRERRGYAATQA